MEETATYLISCPDCGERACVGFDIDANAYVVCEKCKISSTIAEVRADFLLAQLRRKGTDQQN